MEGRAAGVCLRRLSAEQAARQIKAKLTRPEFALISSEKLLEALACERHPAARTGRRRIPPFLERGAQRPAGICLTVSPH